MKSLILYHSETGNTGRVAEYIHKNTDSDIIELKPEKPYSKFRILTSGIKRALMQQNEDISIQKIDLSSYDAMIIGTPVWGGHPTPVINAVFEIITGCEGKEAFAFATFGKSDGETLKILRKRLEDLEMHVHNTFGFTAKDTEDEIELERIIKNAGL